jgi:hypothetical protein
VNKIELPVNLVQAIVNYLQARPYAEVAALIGEIMKHQPAVHEAPDDSEAAQNPK